MNAVRVTSVAAARRDTRARNLTRVAAAAATRFLGEPALTLRPLRLVENGVFEIETAAHNRFALRVHRHGFRTKKQIESELAFMGHLASRGTRTPQPVAGLGGHFVQTVWDDDAGVEQLCSMMAWIDGVQLDDLPPEVGLPMLGEAMAKTHDGAQSFRPPAEFDRLTWDVAGLVGPDAVLGDYRKVLMSTSERELFDRAAESIASAAIHYGTGADRFGLIHGDWLENNAMHNELGCHVIDFDDCGWGWFVFDMVTSAYRGKYVFDDPVWADLLLSGYRRHRRIDDGDLELVPYFLAARTLALVGWLAARPDHGARRRHRCIDSAVQHCRLLTGDTAPRGW